jgi:preprotein translocase subunit SecY
VKKLISTLKNIWSIKELREKIIYTFILIFVYIIGTNIILPGVNSSILKQTVESNKSGEGILGLLNSFSGGGFLQASILALGIMPYISASIFMQLATILVPALKKVQQEGESGRKKINQYTRYLAVIVTLFQAAAYISYLRSMGSSAGSVVSANFDAYFNITTIIVLTAGTLFAMWLGERITDKGLGNGTSIIIMIGILQRLPSSFAQEFGIRATEGTGGLLKFVIGLVLLIAIIMGCILLVQGVRRITVNYAKQIVGNKQFGGARQYLPIKVNSSGVMPIIFAQAILFIPTIFSRFDTTKGFAAIFNDHTNVWYMVIYSIIVILFTYLYTSLIFNPRQISDDLKRSNGFIPGIKPGEPTADYIGTIMDRITLPGAIMLALLGILPGVCELVLGLTKNWSTFFGGTSLLIMVGVVLDTLQAIETQLLTRQYDGLMSSGRIQGRNQGQPVQASPIG